jgi:hypothetical protein
MIEYTSVTEKDLAMGQMNKYIAKDLLVTIPNYI